MNGMMLMSLYNDIELQYDAHINKIMSYESRLENEVEKKERNEVESEIVITVFDMTDDDPEVLSDEAIVELGRGRENCQQGSLIM